MEIGLRRRGLRREKDRRRRRASAMARVWRRFEDEAEREGEKILY